MSKRIVILSEAIAIKIASGEVIAVDNIGMYTDEQTIPKYSNEFVTLSQLP